jgi:hypothetical protein
MWDCKTVPMEKPSRILFLVAATIGGLLAIMAWSVTIYAFVETPSLSEIILPPGRGNPVVVNKTMALLVPASYQTVIFLMALYPIIRWNSPPRQASREAPRKNLVTSGTESRLPAGGMWCVGLCAISAINLYMAAQQISLLLSQR